MCFGGFMCWCFSRITAWGICTLENGPQSDRHKHLKKKLLKENYGFYRGQIPKTSIALSSRDYFRFKR